MNNQEFERFMDKLYGPFIPYWLWNYSQTIGAKAKIQYLIGKKNEKPRQD